MTPISASLLRAPTPASCPSSGAFPNRTTDLTICALLAIVTVGLLVLAV